MMDTAQLAKPRKKFCRLCPDEFAKSTGNLDMGFHVQWVKGSGSMAPCGGGGDQRSQL